MNEPQPQNPPTEPRDRKRWPDFILPWLKPPFRNHLPRFQPGMPFPQPPGQQDWNDDLTVV